MRRRVLILGGSGLIGTAVTKEIDRDKTFEAYPTYYQNAISDTQGVLFNMEEPYSIYGILETIGPEIIVSCLRGDFNKQLSVHMNLAEYLKVKGGRLYFFSTANVFDNDLSKPHDEDDVPDTQTEYGQYKIECENKIRETLGDRAYILRIPQVWGKNSMRMNQLLRCLAGNEEIVVYPNLYYNTNTDIMIARQVLHIIKKGLRGIFHLAADDIINYKDFYVKLIKGLGFDTANMREDDGDAGYFAIVSKRIDEFPEQLRSNNQSVIKYLIEK